jgi:hypothetical protein
VRLEHLMAEGRQQIRHELQVRRVIFDD